MKHLVSRNWLLIVGAFLGAVAGFMYWKMIGCSSGTCAITSKPLNSSLYFGMIGALVAGLFKKEQKSKSTTDKL
ncbi:MAG: DUF6132 family protein [Bacteroidota bacterium]